MDKYFAVVFDGNNESVIDVRWHEKPEHALDAAHLAVGEGDPGDCKLYKIMVFCADDAVINQVFDVSAEGKIYETKKAEAPATK